MLSVSTRARTADTASSSSTAAVTIGAPLVASTAFPTIDCASTPAGFTQSMNYDLTDGDMMSLPVFVYNSYISQGVDAQAYIDRAWAGALTLILIVMLLNLLARLVAKIFAPKLGR